MLQGLEVAILETLNMLLQALIAGIIQSKNKHCLWLLLQQKGNKFCDGFLETRCQRGKEEMCRGG